MGIKFERKFLRPDDLLQRWQCSEADLRNEVVEGNLSPVVFVHCPEDFTDREGRLIFQPDEHYKMESEHWLGPKYLNRGYLILKSPIRESIDTCSFSLFASYQDSWDGKVMLPECMLPLDKYWKEIVFALPHILEFEIERTERRDLVASMDRPLVTRERTSYLNIIGAMRAQLTAGKANDTTVITQAVIDYGTKDGISERKLQEVFAAAKRSLGAS